MSKIEPQSSSGPGPGPEQKCSGRISISFVVAVAENGVIGREGGLPWRLSSDLKLFRRLTMGKPILMGRRTWESLPKQPLDGRDNIVVTRDKHYRAEGAFVVGDVHSAVSLGCRLATERGVDEIAVIGGAALYADLLDKVDRMYWTTVHGAPEGDTTFPPFDASEWQTVEEERLPRGPNDDFDATLRVLVRRQKEAQ
jgi:dihydrofolate reductase